MSDFERVTAWLPGHAMRENYGRSSLQCRHILAGALGSIEFRWRPGPTPERVGSRYGQEWMSSPASGSHIGYHFDQPTEYQLKQGPSDCDVRHTGRCYFDASYSDSDNVLEVFLLKGEEAMWQSLERRYDEWTRDLVNAADLWVI